MSSLKQHAFSLPLHFYRPLYISNFRTSRSIVTFFRCICIYKLIKFYLHKSLQLVSCATINNPITRLRPDIYPSRSRRHCWQSQRVERTFSLPNAFNNWITAITETRCSCSRLLSGNGRRDDKFYYKWNTPDILRSV